MPSSSFHVHSPFLNLEGSGVCVPGAGMLRRASNNRTGRPTDPMRHGGTTCWPCVGTAKCVEALQQGGGGGMRHIDPDLGLP